MRSQNFPKDCFPKAPGQVTSLRLHGFPVNTLDWNIRSLGDLRDRVQLCNSVSWMSFCFVLKVLIIDLTRERERMSRGEEEGESEKQTPR